MNRYTKITVIAILAVVTLLVSAAWAGTRSLAWLGVVTQEVDREIAKEFSLTSRSGAIINEVVDNSPAEKAGLKEDDIILAFNDETVRDDDDLTDLVHDSRPGDSVTLTVFRGGAEQKIAVKLGRRSNFRSWFGNRDSYDIPRVPAVPMIPDVPMPPLAPLADFDSKGFGHYYQDSPYMGVTLIELSDEAAQAFGSAKGGVLINEVESDSPAETAGIKPGDIIVGIDGDAVYETEDIQDVIGDLDEGDTVQVSLIRDRKPLSVNVIVELYSDGGRHRRHGDIRIPDMSGFHLSQAKAFKRDYALAMKEFSEESKDYQDEMRALQRDLKKMREDLGGMKKSNH